MLYEYCFAKKTSVLKVCSMVKLFPISVFYRIIDYWSRHIKSRDFNINYTIPQIIISRVQSVPFALISSAAVNEPRGGEMCGRASSYCVGCSQAAVISCLIWQYKGTAANGRWAAGSKGSHRGETRWSYRAN